MSGLSKSFSTYVNHTGRYYARLFEPMSAKIAIAALALTVIVTSTVVTHAGVAKWMLEDVLNESILKADYNYVKSSEAPELTDNKFHLQMPMMVEDYIRESNYVSGGTSDPANPKIDDAMNQTLKPSYFNADDIDLGTKDEWEDAAEDGTEFVENRPPHSGLK